MCSRGISQPLQPSRQVSIGSVPHGIMGTPFGPNGPCVDRAQPSKQRSSSTAGAARSGGTYVDRKAIQRPAHLWRVAIREGFVRDLREQAARREVIMICNEISTV